MDSDSAWLTRFFAQLAYVAMALIAVFTRASLIDLAIIFGGLMLVGMLVQIGLGVAILVEKKRLGVI